MSSDSRCRDKIFWDPAEQWSQCIREHEAGFKLQKNINVVQHRLSHAPCMYVMLSAHTKEQQ